MCLSIPLFSRIKVAKVDIPVYKVLIYQTHIQRSCIRNWETPFMNVPVIPSEKVIHSDLKRSLKLVNQGLHSYADKHEAEHVAKRMESTSSMWGEVDAKVFHATIPKGARYYSGVHSLMSVDGHTDHLSSFASSQLIIHDRYA